MKALPCDPQAEMALVATVLSWRAEGLVEAGDLRADEFYAPPMSSLWAAIRSLPPDQLDLTGVLRVMRQSGTAHRLRALVAGAVHGVATDSEEGQLAYLGLLAANHSTVPSALRGHAARVRSCFTLRAALLYAEEIRTAAEAADAEGGAVLAEAQKKLVALTSQNATARMMTIGQATTAARRRLEEAAKGDPNARPIPSTFPGLAHMLRGGYFVGKQYVIAGRPAMGKSAFAMTELLTAAFAGYPGIVLSFEMDPVDVGERSIGSHGSVDLSQLPEELGMRDWIQISKSDQKMQGLPITIVDAGGMSMSQCSAIVRRWRMEQDEQMQQRPCLIATDYLQLVKGDTKRGNNETREREVAEFSMGFRNLAKEPGVRGASMLLSQLSRKCEERSDKRPMLSDLRETGAIEQDADAVAFLYRDEVYNKKTSDAGIAEVIIAKQRGGSIGTVRTKFVGQYTRFEPLVDDAQQDFLPPAPPAGYYGDDDER